MMLEDESGQARLLSDIVFWGERLARHLHGKLMQRWPEFAARSVDLELSKAYAMRNRLSQGYFTIDVGVVWRAATVSVPELIKNARQVRDAN